MPNRAPTSSCSTRIGELATIYQIATVVFVGGSLVATGGHNILEPAVFGKPIVFGPHMENFAEIAEAFVANGAGVQVTDERELDDVLVALMSDPVRRARLGAAARALVEANRGAKDKRSQVLAALLPRATEPPSLPTSGRSDPLLDLLYAQAVGVAAALVRAPPAGAPSAAATRHQRRQLERRRHRQNADGRVDREWLLDARRASRDPQPRLRPATSRATAWSSFRTARRVLADVDQAGDEPLMLARAVAGRGGLRVRGSLPGRRRLPSGDSAPPSTCSTTAFSTCSWRAISTCCDAPGEIADGRVLPLGRLREAIGCRRARASRGGGR